MKRIRTTIAIYGGMNLVGKLVLISDDAGFIAPYLRVVKSARELKSQKTEEGRAIWWIVFQPDPSDQREMVTVHEDASIEVTE